MAVWRFLMLFGALVTLSAPEAAAQGLVAQETFAGKPRAVPVRVYNEKDQLTGSGWALPMNGAYVTVRSLLANAARAELALSDESRAAVSEVGSEDIEGNLVIVAADAFTAQPPDSANASDPPPAPQFTVPPSVPQFSREADTASAEMEIVCGSTSYPLRERRVRDIPVFGLAFVGETRHRDSIAGCPVLGRDGALDAVVVWEDPFGHPSVALVPATRATQLSASPRIPWNEWRAAQRQPERRLRNSLLSEALADIWREHYDLARENLTYLLEQDPTDARGWYYRGYARAMTGKRSLAVVDYENAVYFEPGNAEARFSLGFSYALLHRIPEAREQVAALEGLNGALAQRLRIIVDAVAEAAHENTPAGEAPAVAEPAPEPPPRG